MVVQLEKEVEQKRREHRECKPESVQAGAVANKLEALEKNNAKLEQDMACKTQEFEKLKAALQDMQEQRPANNNAIKALRAEVGSMAGRMGVGGSTQANVEEQLSQQDFAEHPDVAEMLKSPVFAKGQYMVSVAQARA
ncbi:MAG: hypothetical protein ACKPKO_05220, partial [Candidatus Fonsibacter sp.]